MLAADYFEWYQERKIMTKKVKALELADALDAQVALGGGDLQELTEAAAELRRQHENHIKAWDVIHSQGVELIALRKQLAAAIAKAEKETQP
jgi:hypothetical protein